MQTQIPPELLSRIDALADKLGVTAQFIWSVLLSQARVEATVDILTGVGSIVLGYIFWRASNWAWQKAKNDDYDNPGWILSGVLLGIGIVVLGIFAATNLYAAITPLINPNYWALQQIFQIFK